VQRRPSSASGLDAIAARGYTFFILLEALDGDLRPIIVEREFFGDHPVFTEAADADWKISVKVSQTVWNFLRRNVGCFVLVFSKWLLY